MKHIANLLLAVLMLSLAVAAGGCGSQFQLESLELSPEVCLAGETVTVSATLTYSGDIESDYDAELLIDGVVEQTQTLTVGPGSSQSLSFTLTNDEPGSHLVQIGKLTAPLMVVGVSNFNLSSPEVEAGQPVTVSADLENVTDTQSAVHCRLLCRGTELMAEDIAIAGGSKEPVTFDLSDIAPGTYELQLGKFSGSLRVLRPAEFKIVNFDIAPNPVKVGGVATIILDVENTGEVEGTYSPKLRVDGVVQEAKDIAVAGGTVYTESFPISKDSPGYYSVQLDGQEAALEVIETVRLSNGTVISREMDYGKSQLKIVNNRGLDVVVVLSSVEKPGAPLLAFYVRADADWTIARLPVGPYFIYFTFGEDWDDNGKRFITAASYDRFEVAFSFEAPAGKYRIWTITFSDETMEYAQPVSEDTFPGLS
jgi:hypothetical protein